MARFARHPISMNGRAMRREIERVFEVLSCGVGTSCPQLCDPEVDEPERTVFHTYRDLVASAVAPNAACRRRISSWAPARSLRLRASSMPITSRYDLEEATALGGHGLGEAAGRIEVAAASSRAPCRMVSIASAPAMLPSSRSAPGGNIPSSAWSV